LDPPTPPPLQVNELRGTRSVVGFFARSSKLAEVLLSNGRDSWVYLPTTTTRVGTLHLGGSYPLPPSTCFVRHPLPCGPSPLKPTQSTYHVLNPHASGHLFPSPPTPYFRFRFSSSSIWSPFLYFKPDSAPDVRPVGCGPVEQPTYGPPGNLYTRTLNPSRFAFFLDPSETE